MITRRNFHIASLAALAMGSGMRPNAAVAQPSRLASVVVGFPAGGGSDVAARALVGLIRPAYPAGIVVEDRPGAGARLAVDHVKNSAADGATLLFTPDFPITIYPHRALLR